MSAISRLNTTLAKRTGLIIRQYSPSTPLDAELGLLRETYKISTIIDVGAHIGGFALHQRSQGFKGRIISFEPFADSYYRLASAAVNDENWETHNFALGSSDSRADLHAYSGDGQFNSLKRLSDFAPQYQPGIHGISSREVQVSRLDSLWLSLDVDASTSLLKVDTQGYDLEVLAGAGELLSRFPGVLMEVAVKTLYEDAPLLDEVISFMRGHGFEMTGAFPIHRHDDGVRVIEFDCTFCNVGRES